jgi:lysophospholipase
LTHGSAGLVGLVALSPYLGTAERVNPIKEAAGKLMSRILPKVSMPSGLLGENAARDEALVASYEKDPLMNPNANARWYTETVATQAKVQARIGELKIPLLMLYAGDDRIVAADLSDRLAMNLRMTDKTTERIAGAFHELVNEPPAAREKIIARVGDWILAHAAKQSAHGDAA